MGRSGTYREARRDFAEQISPMWVLFLDELALPIPPPSLQLLLARDRDGIVVERLPTNERVHAVAFGESRNKTLLMFNYAANEIVRYADVQRALWLACEDIDVKELDPAVGPGSALRAVRDDNNNYVRIAALYASRMSPPFAHQTRS